MGQYYAVRFPCVGQIDPVRIPGLPVGGPLEFTLTSALILLLKKTLLDPEILNHFRLISNLVYISKLVEKSVSLKVTNHGLYDFFKVSEWIIIFVKSFTLPNKRGSMFC